MKRIRNAKEMCLSRPGSVFRMAVRGAVEELIKYCILVSKLEIILLKPKATI